MHPRITPKISRSALAAIICSKKLRNNDRHISSTCLYNKWNWNVTRHLILFYHVYKLMRFLIVHKVCNTLHLINACKCTFYAWYVSVGAPKMRQLYRYMVLFSHYHDNHDNIRDLWEVAYWSRQHIFVYRIDPDNKVCGVNMNLSAPDGPHVGPMNLAIGGSTMYCVLDN